MKRFKLFIEQRVFDDIQEGINYYNGKQKGLGRRFHTAVKHTFNSIRKIPFYQIRYDDIRCLMVEGFPYMIHFCVNESDNTITVYAVICTWKDPETSWVNK